MWPTGLTFRPSKRSRHRDSRRPPTGQSRERTRGTCARRCGRGPAFYKNFHRQHTSYAPCTRLIRSTLYRHCRELCAWLRAFAASGRISCGSTYVHSPGCSASRSACNVPTPILTRRNVRCPECNVVLRICRFMPSSSVNSSHVELFGLQDATWLVLGSPASVDVYSSRRTRHGRVSLPRMHKPPAPMAASAASLGVPATRTWYRLDTPPCSTRLHRTPSFVSKSSPSLSRSRRPTFTRPAGRFSVRSVARPRAPCASSTKEHSVLNGLYNASIREPASCRTGRCCDPARREYRHSKSTTPASAAATSALSSPRNIQRTQVNGTGTSGTVTCKVVLN